MSEPRDWLLANLSRLRTAQLQVLIDQAIGDGYEPGARITNNKDRIRWLTAARQMHWDRQHKKRVKIVDDALDKLGTGAVQTARRRTRFMGGITAAEANAFLRTLPIPKPYGDDDG